jgi:hypothetical protein
MGSFAKYINGGPPQLSDPENGPEAYNFMKGFDLFGDPIINPQTNQSTKFWHPGDPVAGTGWLDTDHRDKRFLMSAGPFTLKDGDVQEFVVGIVIAQGNTGTQSVELLKRNDAVAQLAYDINFALPPSPPSPVVTVSTQEQVITLKWDAAAESYEALDRVDIDSLGNPTKYTFQGYNVYQLNSANITAETSIKKIASFDLQDGIVKIRDDVFLPSIGQTANIVVQDIEDSGMKRFLRITVDALSGNAPLIQNRKYYFAVTAFGYNPNGIPRVLESPIQVIGKEQGIRPQSPPLGTSLSGISAFGDTLAAARVSGGSDGGMIPIVVDPTELTGHTYKVRFRDVAGRTVYDVIDSTDGNKVKAEGFTNQSDKEGEFNYPIVDGVLVKVLGAANNFKDFLTVSNANGPLDPPDYAAFGFNGSGFPSDILHLDRPSDRQQVGGGHWGFQTGEVGGGFLYDFFLERVMRGTNFSRFVPFDFEMRFTAAGGFAIMAFTTESLVPVPFELWNIGVGTPNDPSDDYRMIPWIFDVDGNDAFNLVAVDHTISGGDNDPETDWIYWRNPANTSPGTAGYDKFVADAQAGTYDFASPEVMARTVLVNWNGGSVADPTFPANVNQVLPETGTVFRILSTKPNRPGVDVFSFKTTAPTRENSALAAEQAAKLVNVYPNPYRGFNIEEKDPANRFVTFTHLPGDNTTIQIFSLSGDLVRRIVHDNGTQFEQWDLRNSSDVPVASGVYIARIDMGGVGVKLLKLAILQPQERLDVF